jgi:hypothetical protein
MGINQQPQLSSHRLHTCGPIDNQRLRRSVEVCGCGLNAGMPGRHVNDQQVRLYMKLRPTRSQESAAAISGISVATGRRIERDPRPPSLRKEPRDYRTRSDPFEGLWDEEIVPMLESAPGLRPITVLRELAQRHPDRIDDSVRRSLERRIRTWRAMHGPDQPVIFPQAHAPGRMGLSDHREGCPRMVQACRLCPTLIRNSL